MSHPQHTPKPRARPLRWLVPVAACAAALLSSCAGVSAVPGSPGKEAKSLNIWPLYKSATDENAKLSETQVLWPFFKSKSVGEESMARLWPLFYTRSGPTALDGATLEGALSSLAVLSATSTPKGDGITGLIHPWILNVGSHPVGKDGEGRASGFSLFPYPAIGVPMFGRVVWPRKDLYMGIIPIYYKTIDVKPAPSK